MTPPTPTIEEAYKELRETISWAVEFEYRAPHNKHKSMQDVIETLEYKCEKVVEAKLTLLITKARIDTAQHIQDTMVSPGSGGCDEIMPDAIPKYVESLKKGNK